MEIGIDQIRRPAPEQAPANELGKNDFVKLLMAQLGNQDPTSPMDSQAFVAQLAQFASVEQLQGIGSRLDSLVLAQASANQTATASLVGRELLYRTDTAQLEAEGGVELHGQLAAPAQSVTVTILDSSGKVVRTIRLGEHEAGPLHHEWDGLDDRGERLPPGSYKVQLAAANQEGKSVAIDSRARGQVTGVSFENGYPELMLGTKKIKLSEIVEIKQ